MRQSRTSGRRPWRLSSRIASECLAAALLAAASVGAAAPQARQAPIVINAAFSRVDYNTNTVIFRNIVVSQGEMRLTAGRAHADGVGFANSRWTFDDAVVIELEPRGTLRCEHAVVTFRDNGISEATATGQPAQFESRSAARGSAHRIVYDAQHDSVRLSGDARFSDAHGLEMSGQMLVYDIRNERLQAASPGERRGVHITITPRALSEKRQPPARRGPRR